MSDTYTPNATRLPGMLEILASVCREDGYGFACVDEFSRQLVRVTKGRHIFFAGIGRVQNFPLNSATAASLARDKAFTYQGLAAAGIEVPPYDYVFLDPAQIRLRAPGRERGDAAARADRLGYPIIVKPLDGARGTLVDTAYDARDLDRLLDAISSRHHAALLQPVLDGEEWRLFLVDGEAQFGYRRERPTLIGNGRTSLGALLEAENRKLEGFGLSLITPASPYLAARLRAHRASLETILPPGEHFCYSPRGNLSTGGMLSQFTEAPPPAWISWAKDILAALTLRVGALDFFVAGGKLSLIEVNHTPDLSGLIRSGHDDVARKVWRRVLALYFADCEARAP